MLLIFIFVESANETEFKEDFSTEEQMIFLSTGSPVKESSLTKIPSPDEDADSSITKVPEPSAGAQTGLWTRTSVTTFPNEFPESEREESEFESTSKSLIKGFLSMGGIHNNYNYYIYSLGT